jgi:hypothetical protein
MVDEVLDLLESRTQDQASTLAADMTAGDSSFTVTSARGIALGLSPGVVEIGSELLYVSGVSNVTATVEPWGRGFDSTVPAAHTAGSRVVSQPTFPRARVLDKINQGVGRVYPELFAVASYETTTTYPVTTYDTPDDLKWVLDVRWQPDTQSLRWVQVQRWRLDPGGGTQVGDGLNGLTIEIGDRIPDGRPLHVLYAKAPTLLASETDVFETVTGLPASCRDVVELAAAAALTPSLELSRLQVSSAEQQNRAGLVAPSAALTSSRVLEASFQQRLREEQQSLRKLYPPRIMRMWR